MIDLGTTSVIFILLIFAAIFFEDIKITFTI